MNHLKRVAFAVVVAGLLSACAHIVSDIRYGGAAIRKPDIATEEGNLGFVLGGIAQTQTVDAARICGGAEKVVQVEYVSNFGDAVVAFITLGIYTPVTYRVYCTE